MPNIAKILLFLRGYDLDRKQWPRSPSPLQLLVPRTVKSSSRSGENKDIRSWDTHSHFLLIFCPIYKNVGSKRGGTFPMLSFLLYPQCLEQNILWVFKNYLLNEVNECIPFSTLRGKRFIYLNSPLIPSVWHTF